MSASENRAAPAISLIIPEAAHGARLDRALAMAAAQLADAEAAALLSRSRLQALLAAGAIVEGGPEAPKASVTDARRKVKAGERFTAYPPPPAPIGPEPEAIALDVVYEDDHLVIVDKPAGMTVHPAPGAESGTLVNALLAHCDALSSVGGPVRPGIVHRIDKDTSGLIVAAKTDSAHRGLQEQFAAHDLERSYLAVAWGAPEAGDPRLRDRTTAAEGWLTIDAALGRHASDRKRMAVRADGKRAVTRLQAITRWRLAGAPVASLIECRLQTGRTHQIRVHLSWLGFPLIGDPVYGKARRAPAAAPESLKAAINGFRRQALHAATLGFRHPITGEALRFERAPPTDMAGLIAAFTENLSAVS